jgi:hypothetical protein
MILLYLPVIVEGLLSSFGGGISNDYIILYYIILYYIIITLYCIVLYCIYVIFYFILFVHLS